MIKRYITQRGQVLYRNTDTGRFVNQRTGAREFVRQNIETIRNNRTQGLRYNDLNTRERQSFSAQNRYRYNGQFIPNPFNYLSQFDTVTRGNRNLENFFSREDLRQLGVFSTPFASRADGEGNALRVRGQLYDVVNEVRDYISRGYDFNLITPDGDILNGIDAANYLRQWESETIENIRQQGRQNGRELDRILINYNIAINQINRTIEIDLNEIDTDTDIEAYFDTP
jgi:hypothetical protein